MASTYDDWAALRAALEKVGFSPTRALGQNFLVDSNLLDAIARDAAIEPTERVVEIGPGPGWLTRRLAQRAAHVTAFELDERIVEYLRDELEGMQNVEVVSGDALGGSKRGLHPRLREELQRGCVLVANLPYGIASALLANLARHNPPPRRSVVMVQREVADRLCAQPATGDFGALTVAVRATLTVERLRELSPSVFRPRPKVHSTVLRLAPMGRELRDDQWERLDRVLRVAFGERRKQLAPRLSAAAPPHAPVAAWLVELGVPAGVRGEALSVEQLLALAERLGERPREPGR
ncbi:MAG: ribosomal RNA small subunit methyltransferase A [Planctomycetes bacterium]|nr:ribosomal RNA small subunit methyltransferase A [Planctomycetota bacterium]